MPENAEGATKISFFQQLKVFLFSHAEFQFVLVSLFRKLQAFVMFWISITDADTATVFRSIQPKQQCFCFSPFSLQDGMPEGGNGWCLHLKPTFPTQAICRFVVAKISQALYQQSCHLLSIVSVICIRVRPLSRRRWPVLVWWRSSVGRWMSVSRVRVPRLLDRGEGWAIRLLLRAIRLRCVRVEPHSLVTKSAAFRRWGFLTKSLPITRNNFVSQNLPSTGVACDGFLSFGTLWRGTAAPTSGMACEVAGAKLRGLRRCWSCRMTRTRF